MSIWNTASECRLWALIIHSIFLLATFSKMQI